MPRPKSDERPFSTRMPLELKADIASTAALMPGRSDGDFVKESIEFKLKLAWVIQADWYTIRQYDPRTLRLHCMTMDDK
jgi:hypothetical protein